MNRSDPPTPWIVAALFSVVLLALGAFVARTSSDVDRLVAFELNQTQKVTKLESDDNFLYVMLNRQDERLMAIERAMPRRGGGN